MIKISHQPKVPKKKSKMSTNPWRSLYKDYCNQSSTSNHCYLFDYFTNIYDAKLTNTEKFDIFNWKTFSKLFESSEKIYNMKEMFGWERVWKLFKELDEIPNGREIFNKVIKAFITEPTEFSNIFLSRRKRKTNPNPYKGKPPKTEIEAPKIISKHKTLNKMWKCNIIMPSQDRRGLIETAILEKYPYEYLYDYLKRTETMPLNGSNEYYVSVSFGEFGHRTYSYYIPYLSIVRNLHPFSLDPKEVAEIVSLFYLKRKELTDDLMKDVTKYYWSTYKKYAKVTSGSRHYFEHDYSTVTIFTKNFGDLGFDLDDYYPEISKLHPELNYSWYLQPQGPLG